MITVRFFDILYQDNQGKASDLFINPEVVGSLIGVVFGIIAAVLVQVLLERRQRLRLTYSVETEIPLTLAKEELREKLRILYQGTPVDQLYFFRLRIANTGKKTIRNQTFTCLFSENAKPIDPQYPEISTEPPREVGPIVKDTSVTKNNEFRYEIAVLGIAHSVQLDFLMVGKGVINLRPHFRPNHDQGQEVVIHEGDITGQPTLESQLRGAFYGLLIFYGLREVAGILPYPLGAPLALIGIPFLILGLRSLIAIIPVLVRKLQDEREPTYELSSIGGTVVISGGSGTASVTNIDNPNRDKNNTVSDTSNTGATHLQDSADSSASTNLDSSNSLIPPPSE